jgi:peptide/nickel transport system ATP-binding protein
MSPVIAVRDLVVETQRDDRLLDDVSLEADEGEVIALVGASGSGKTTLAQAVLGSIGTGARRIRGDVAVAEHDPFTPRGRQAVRGRIAAYLPQDPASALDPQRSVRGQLRMADRIAHPRSTSAERSQRVDAAMAEAVFDSALARRRPAQLSGGQAQRALLAWVYLIRPRLLILDEPTSGLDPETAARVARGFTGLSWRPAVVLISHDAALVEQVATRVLTMQHGRLVERRRPRTALATSVTRARADTPPPPSRPALHAVDVTLRRGGKTLLDGATLALADGELAALRGRSGSGKTSLAHALCGHAVPAAGSLAVAGTAVPWSAERRVKEQAPFIAYVPQDARAALNPHETVRRTLERATRTASRRAGPSRLSPEELLDLLELPRDTLSRRPGELSGGQRHRVTLARALAAQPAAVVADEVTASLDAATVDTVLDALDAYRRRTGSPLLLIAHQERVIARADRVMVLDRGTLGGERP